MKATLQFDLPEDSLDFEFCSKGPELVDSLWELIVNTLPAIIDCENNSSDLTSEEAEKFRDFLISHFRDSGLMEVIDKNF